MDGRTFLPGLLGHLSEDDLKHAAKTGFEIQSYIPRTHEMKNRILSKNKGCLFFLRSKIYQLSEYYMMFARKILFLRNLGGGNCLSCLSYAYVPRPPL